jgi:signal transduction histidine kinase
MGPCRSCWALVLALLAAFPAHGQATDWGPQQYTSQNGLPQNSVIDMAMDTLGFLWLSTEGGLVRFDGRRFTPIKLPDEGGSSWERMRDIVPLADGSFVVRNASGDHVHLSGDRILELAPASARRPHLRMIRGGAPSMRLLLRTMDRVDSLPGASQWAGPTVLMHAEDGHHWTIATQRALLHFKDSTLVRRVVYERPLLRRFRLLGRWYGSDDNGRPWMVDEATGALHAVAVDGPHAAAITRLLTTGAPGQDLDDSHVLLRDDRRVYLLLPGADPQRLRVSMLPLELPSGCAFNELLWSPVHRVLFAGTDTKGLFMYRERGMLTRVCEPSKEGRNNAYYALQQVGGDTLLALSSTYHTLFTPQGCVNIEIRPWPQLNYQMVSRAEGGRLLAARHDRLVEIDPVAGSDRVLLRRPGLLVTAIRQDGDTLWLADAQGVGIVVDSAYRQLLRIGNTTAFTRVNDAMWAATCSGVVRFHDSGVIDTLPGIGGACVRSIQVVDDLVFIGTYGRGAYLLSAGRSFPLPLDRQGFLTHVHAFAKDRAGMLWMSTNRGLVRVSLLGLRSWLGDPEHHVHYAYFGVEDGILNPEFNGGCDPAHLQLPDGRLVFPSLEGIVVFDPLALADPVPKGRVIINRVYVDGIALSPGDEQAISPDHEDLVVAFTLPYWGSPANMQLEYRLGPEGSRWIPVGLNDREIRFTRLPPGEHELAIRKLGAPEGEGPTVLRLTVLTPAYRRPWFLAMAGLLGMIALMAGVRLNEARLRRRNQELEEAVQQRTMELEQANERLRRSVEVKERLVSIISHDIVTPLRFIARVARAIGGGRAGPELEENLHDIALSSDKLHANARNLLSWIKHQEGRIELRPMHVALNPLVEDALDLVRALAASKGDTLVNDVPLDDVLRTDRDLLLIILQNLISNAVNYTRNGEVRVRGIQADGHYDLCVCDTGPGMSPKALAHVRDIISGRHGRRGTEHGDPEMQGLGYVIIGELGALLGGTVTVDVRPEGGTSVTIRLPLRQP